MTLQEAIATARQVRAYGFNEGTAAQLVALVDGCDERTRMLDQFLMMARKGKIPSTGMVKSAARLVSEGR